MRKIAVRNIFKYFLFMMIISGIVLFPSGVNAASGNTYAKATVSEQTWYKKVLKDRNKVYHVTDTWGGKKFVTTISDFPNYSLHDINGDGIKELFLFGYSCNCLVLGYYKGKVKPLFYSGWIRRARYIGKNIVFSRGSSMASTFYVYQLKGNKLKEIINFFWTTSSIVPLQYKVNGKTCSKSVFYAQYNKYVKKAKRF